MTHLSFSDTRKCCSVAGAVFFLCCILVPVSALHGQTLTAEFGLPTSSGFPGPLRVETTSSYTEGYGGLYTITDTVGFTGSYGNLTSAVGSFAWFSIQQDGSGFPKIWADSFTYTDPDPEPVVYTNATSTWQTLTPIQASPGIIYTNATWYSDPEWVTVVDSTPGLVPWANATTWSMGPQTPVGIRDNSLSSSFGNPEERLLLDSDVTPFGDQYRYTYTLTNTLDEELAISWGPASLDITMNPGEVYVHSFMSESDGMQANGYATINGESIANVEMMANAIIPVPEPITLSLVLAASTVIIVRRRRTC